MASISTKSSRSFLKHICKNITYLYILPSGWCSKGYQYLQQQQVTDDAPKPLLMWPNVMPIIFIETHNGHQDPWDQVFWPGQVFSFRTWVWWFPRYVSVCNYGRQQSKGVTPKTQNPRKLHTFSSCINSTNLCNLFIYNSPLQEISSPRPQGQCQKHEMHPQ